MRIHQKPTGTASGFPAGLATGTLAAMLITVVMAALLAELINREIIRLEAVGYGVMIILFLASFAGASISYGHIQRRRGLVFLASAVCYLVTLIALTALFFGGQYEGIFPTATLIISGTGCGFLRSVRAGKGRPSYKKQRRIR